jgi:hypothetical protein
MEIELQVGEFFVNDMKGFTYAGIPMIRENGADSEEEM